MTNELKPCPFCDVELRLNNQKNMEHPNNECVLRSLVIHDTKAWTTRPAAPAVDVEGIISEMQLRFFGHKEIARRVVVALAEEGHLAQGWMPIESAPRDDTEVLLAGMEYNEIRIAVCSWTGKEWLSNFCIDHYKTFKSPTHWQPLPQPPKEEDE